MKKLIAIMAVSVFSLLAAHGESEVAGPAKLDLTAITQGNEATQNRTNFTAKGTNFITVESQSLGKSRFTDSNLLALIENSLSTNFPAGSQIGMTNQVGLLAMTNGIGLVVLDSTGTNVIFVPNSVITYAQDADFLGSVHTTQVITVNTNGSSLSGNFSEAIMEGVTITYDDTHLNPKDGKFTQFQFRGLQEIQETLNIKTSVTKQTYEIQGASNDGLVDGVPIILTGEISAKIRGAFH